MFLHQIVAATPDLWRLGPIEIGGWNDALFALASGFVVAAWAFYLREISASIPGVVERVAGFVEIVLVACVFVGVTSAMVVYFTAAGATMGTGDNSDLADGGYMGVSSLTLDELVVAMSSDRLDARSPTPEP